MRSGCVWESQRTFRWKMSWPSMEVQPSTRHGTAYPSLPALWSQTLVHSSFRAVVERSRRKIQRPLPAKVSRQGHHVVDDAASARVVGVRTPAQQHLLVQQSQRENSSQGIGWHGEEAGFSGQEQCPKHPLISRRKVAIIS